MTKKAEEINEKKVGLDSEVNELRQKESELMQAQYQIQNEQRNLEEKRQRYKQIQREIHMDCTIESQLEAKEKELNDLK